MRVLLVEDDELLGDGIFSGLKHYGHTVDWVKDGKSAFEALSRKQESFDVVVLDLGLPKMSGLDVLRKIREKNITVPVLILTAKDTVESRVQGLDAGADDYLPKPFDLDELCARMRALQRRSKSRAQPILIHGNITIYPAAPNVTLKCESISLSRR